MSTKNYGTLDTSEIDRLKRQAMLIYKYIDGELVKELFNKLLSRKSPIHVLDLGCANGNSFAERSKGFNDSIIYLGVDSSETALTEAAETLLNFYKETNLIQTNIENETFENDLTNYMQLQNISGFDFVNISSLLLLLQNPQKLLNITKSVLSENGQLFILDIDDRNTCWTCRNPEKKEYYDKLYKKAMEICFNGKTTGNRHSGRNILKMLKSAGFKNFTLLNGTNEEVHGLCTADMQNEDKEAFASMLFNFIKRSVDHPECDESTKVWYYEYLEELKAGFLDPDLTFSLGYMTFLASNSELMLSPNGSEENYEINRFMR